ncbi:hypothetical protein NQZ79_g5696 [Umbelopsis isabellina]|nr:hypothetical protein NQZ79_g5696 [Umbelopsis isabellina]
MGAYSVIQYHQSTTLFSGDETAIVVAYLQGAYNAARWAEITVIVLMVLGVLVFTFLAYKLYLEFGWHIYKKIGADLSMRESSLTPEDSKAGIMKQLVEHIVLSCVVTIAMLMLAFWGLVAVDTGEEELYLWIHPWFFCHVCGYGADYCYCANIHHMFEELWSRLDESYYLLNAMATVPQPYHRVQFSVHVGGKPVPIKLALKPDSTISDALVQLRNVWSADNSKQSILNPNELAVMDSEGFWLPSYSPVNCVLKVNDKVSVYKLNKRKKDIVQDDASKKRKAQSDDDVAVSSPAAQAVVASPKKKAKQDKTETKPESKKIDTKVEANDLKPSKEDNKRKRKKEKKKEKHEEKKAETKKSAEKKSAEKKDEQKHQAAQAEVTEPTTDNADQSDAPDQKRKRPRKARQERREHKQHIEADKKVIVEPSSTTETDVKTTAVDSSKEVQVTHTDDQAAEILAADAPSAGSIGDEESNGQTSSDEVENKKISQAADYLQKHAGLLDSIAGSTTDGTRTTGIRA